MFSISSHQARSEIEMERGCDPRLEPGTEAQIAAQVCELMTSELQVDPNKYGRKIL